MNHTWKSLLFVVTSSRWFFTLSHHSVHTSTSFATQSCNSFLLEHGLSHHFFKTTIFHYNPTSLLQFQVLYNLLCQAYIEFYPLCALCALNPKPFILGSISSLISPFILWGNKLYNLFRIWLSTFCFLDVLFLLSLFSLCISTSYVLQHLLLAICASQLAFWFSFVFCKFRLC